MTRHGPFRRRTAPQPGARPPAEPSRPSGLRPSAVLLLALAVSAVLAVAPDAVTGQSVSDPVRLAGLDPVQVRAEAQWDELITMEAGGATPEQFLEALRMTFQETIAEADAAPALDPEAPVTVACHVDTFYDSGLITWALRVQTEVRGDDGAPVITWIRSWVGSYTVQQLHLMFRLGEQCAESFLEEWRGVN